MKNSDSSAFCSNMINFEDNDLIAKSLVYKI